MESSSTRGRCSSPTGRPASPHSSASSSTSSVITRLNAVRPSSSSASSIQNLGGGLESRSVSLNRSQSDSIDIGARYGAQIQNGFGSGELLSESIDVPRAGDSISVTIRFRPLSYREFQRGDEAEVGCWVRLNFIASCISSRSKVDSSLSGIGAQSESKCPDDAGKDTPTAIIVSSTTSMEDATEHQADTSMSSSQQKAKLREAASLGKHVLLKNLMDSLESLKAQVAGRNKDEVEEAINRCI